ncbi:hypothetical protein [Streptomyces tendae]|uniref:hypothetical protein n=1 Tax=Streptomyces tendae TaxID=1932 RepID=UPI003F4CD1DC
MPSAIESAARHTAKECGAYLNNAKMTAEEAIIRAGKLLHGWWLLLRRGKKNLAASRDRLVTPNLAKVANGRLWWSV